MIKKKFEAELSGWKTKLDESLNVIAQLRIDLGNSKQDNKQLQVKYDECYSMIYHCMLLSVMISYKAVVGIR